MMATLSWFGLVVVLMVVGLLLMTSPNLYGKTPPVDTVPHFPGRYADFYQAGEIEIEARYQYVLTQLGEVHIYRRFFPETRTLTLYEEYTDELLSTLHGVYEVYWDSGKPKMLGRYRIGERTGHWEMYRFDGSLQEEGEYTDGHKTGEWLAYHANRELKSIHQYVNGDLHGTAIEYDSTGQMVHRMEYRDGYPVDEAESSPSQEDFAYDYVSEDHPFVETFRVMEKMPLFPGCRRTKSYANHKACADQRLIKFLYKHLKYPVRAYQNGVVGEAQVSFVIEADGSISTIRVLNGLSQDITDELVRLVELMPVWIPGEQDGKPVRVQFNLPVRFSI